VEHDALTHRVRPAFYALAPGGWRDYVSILHLPYTAWNLAYVALGAALAPHFQTSRMLWTMAAFALALGVAAHALDELAGRPLRTRIPAPMLVGLAAVSLGGAVAIGLWAALSWSLGLLVFVAAGAFFVVAYNLELFGGLVHTGLWLALSWAALPILTAYYAQAGNLRLAPALAAGFGVLMIVAQRALSTPVRHARRTLGTTDEVEPMEQALRVLPWANVLLGCAVVAARLT
jgi:hypothetical protein